MSISIEKAATAVMAACALTLTFFFLHDRRSSREEGEHSDTAVIASFAELSPSQYELATSYALPSSKSNTVQVFEVIDVECPFCARYASTMDSLKTILGDSVQIRYINYPLSFHRFAKSGALALECGFRDGHGYELVQSFYSHHDSIGFWPWQTFAAIAGVVDTARFNVCRADPSLAVRLDSAEAVASKLEVRGTPTVFIDRWRYTKPPQLSQLVEDVRRLARGETPR